MKALLLALSVTSAWAGPVPEPEGRPVQDGVPAATAQGGGAAALDFSLERLFGGLLPAGSQARADAVRACGSSAVVELNYRAGYMILACFGWRARVERDELKELGFQVHSDTALLDYQRTPKGGPNHLIAAESLGLGLRAFALKGR